MASIVVVFPKLEEAKGIKNVLVRNGFRVNAACASGTQALQIMDELNGGVIVCGYKMADMMYSELCDNMREDFEMLLVAGQNIVEECASERLVTLATPLKVHDLINTVEMMTQAIDRRRKRAQAKPKVRNEKEIELINEAKKVLMDRNHMSEDEAHKYLQKCSMDSGTNMVETAQMVLAMMS